MFFYRETPSSLWRQSIAKVKPMRNLLLAIRRADEFLREQRPGGLSVDVRHALASRYSRHIEFFMEHDPDFFRCIIEWMSGLGLQAPPNMGQGARQIAKIVGYERTLRFLGALRRLQREARRFTSRLAGYRESTGKVAAPQPA